MSGLGVVLIAGGLGTRLRSVTGALPKPLAPLGDTTLLDHQLERVQALQPDQVVVLACHAAEAVARAVAGRATLVVEPEPLGTAGGLALLPAGCDRWLTLNIDHVSDVDLAQFAAAYTPPALACLTQVQVRIDQGVVEVENERLVAWRERPLVPFTVTTGLYVFAADALRETLQGQRVDMPALVERLAPDGVATHLHRGTWIDAGTPDRLAQATRWLQTQKARIS